MSGHFLRPRPRARRQATAALLCLAVLSGCAGLEGQRDAAADARRDLRERLLIAEVALAVGKVATAREIYRTLSRRFPTAPGPFMGLASIDFDAGDLDGARRNFRRAAERARGLPAKRVRAVLGLARAHLASGDVDRARTRFLEARNLESRAPDIRVSPWILNGLGVTAALQAEYDLAEAHYRRALQLSYDEPGIAANRVRTLLSAGRLDAAERVYGARPSGFWIDDDGEELHRLIREARPAPPAWPEPAGAAPLPESAPNLFHLGAQERTAGSRPVPPSGGTGALENMRRGKELLTLVLGHSRQIRLESSASTVLVVSPEVADVRLISPNLVYVVGKGLGRTSISLIGENQRVREWEVSVELDLVPIRGLLRKHPQFEKVRVQPLLRGVQLTGEIGSPALSDRVLRLVESALPKGTTINNELRTPGNRQVNLEVQIAEVQRSVTESLGINWDVVRRGVGEFGFKIGQLGRGRFAENLLNETIAPAFYFEGNVFRTNRVSGVINALAKAGLANVLARPNVTAASGETASFFSGGEFPLPTGFRNDTIILTYKKYGVLLDFVPTIVDGRRIILKVRPEVSETSSNESVSIAGGVIVPVINVRRAETTVEVADGESFVIAGLFSNSSTRQDTGVPQLQDIPLLGNLFGSTSVETDEKELIVTVTARLVKATPPPDESLDSSGEGTAPKLKGYHF